MLRLVLDKVTATLVNFNPSTEKSGDDDVPYSALRITAARPAQDLGFFSQGLKDWIFNENAPRDLAQGLALRDPHMVFPLKRDEQMENATVTIEYGVGDPMVLGEAKLKDFQLTPHEGGTVVIAFSVLCKPDAWKDVPRLYEQQRQGITLSVKPMDLPVMAEAA